MCHTVLSIPVLITDIVLSYRQGIWALEKWRCFCKITVSVWPGWDVNPSSADLEAILLFLSCWMWGVILGLSLVSVRLWANSPLYEGTCVTAVSPVSIIHRCALQFFWKNILIHVKIQNPVKDSVWKASWNVCISWTSQVMQHDGFIEIYKFKSCVLC